MLVLGDNETGKTTLIAKLQGVEDPKKGSALEYAYIDVRDEYRDGECYLHCICYFTCQNMSINDFTFTIILNYSYLLIIIVLPVVYIYKLYYFKL